MRADLMEILVCPTCKGELALGIEAAEALDDGREEIISGTLDCNDCPDIYRIDEGIPNLLPPELNETLTATRGQAEELHP